MNSPYILDAESAQREQASFISKVYGWMSLALVITALTAMFTANTPELVSFIFGNRIVFYGLILGELAGWLAFNGHSTYCRQAPPRLFCGLFLPERTHPGFYFLCIHCRLAGLHFCITAGTFAAMSVYGYTTKRDLTSFGNILMMALFGLIIASIVNWFWHNPILYWVTTYAGVLIFVGLVAYDTQKIKNMNMAGYEGTDVERKGAIMGALALYLDFINLFLSPAAHFWLAQKLKSTGDFSRRNTYKRLIDRDLSAVFLIENQSFTTKKFGD